MKNLKRIVILIPLLVFPFLITAGCSSDDTSSDSETAVDEDDKKPETAIFEADINLVDEDENLDFKVTGDNATIFMGDLALDGGTINNAFVLELEDENSSQRISMLAAKVTGEGTYVMGEDGFEVAEVFSVYSKDKNDSNLENLYTFHEQTIDTGDQVYSSEVKLTITSLSENRVKGTLHIVMYSSVLEYEGAEEDKKLIGGFVHQGIVSAEFDCIVSNDLQ